MSMYFIASLLFVSFSSVSLLDINECQSKWVSTLNGGYTYRVDCSNLGFKNVPENLSSLTSEFLLNGNSISYIDDKALFSLTSLRTLDLRGNDVTKLEESVFRENQGLKKLYLSGNKLHCDWSIWWLVSFSKTLEYFEGQCFTPILLRGRNIESLTLKDLEIDCLSVSKLRNVVLDGDYPITVFRKDKSTTEVMVYCHNMGSTEPKEFLTLPSAEEQNYVEVKKVCDFKADQKLKEKVELLTDTLSNFTRVRLFLNNLTLGTTDTTFSTNSNLFFGQPSLCGDNQCLPGKSSVDLRGTRFYFKSSKKIIMENECNTQCGTCPIKTFLELDFIDSDRQPFLACTLPIGMQSNKILNESITASSSAGKSFLPHYARLNSFLNGWCSGSNDALQYLQIDLVKITIVSGISTQGHRNKADWVTSYKLFYSKDGEEYQMYQEFGEDKILKGNINSNSVITHWFLPTFRARFIRVNPFTWNNAGVSEHQICMRVELYGCLNDFSSYLIQHTPEGQCLFSDIVANKAEHSVKMNSRCAGDSYMFTYSNDKVQHTKTGLCLSTNSESAFILTSNCETTNLMFQTVESQEMFLIKDLNGNCARIYDNIQTRFLYAIWRKCETGGFSRMRLTINGTSAISPRFNEMLVTLDIKMFTDVKLVCEALSDPISIYRWRKVHPKFKDVKHDLMPSTRLSVFEFKNVTWDDNGTYICEAWNSEGYATKKFNLLVQPIQWFQTKPSNQRVLYGNSVYFDCVSQGIPKPTVSWFLTKGDITSAVSDERAYIFENGTLLIQSISYVDEGNYTCLSSSPRLDAKTFATLDVFAIQSFMKVPASQKVLYSHDVFFECVSEGQPKPIVTWERKMNGRLEEIWSSYKYLISNENTLTVLNLTYEDAGEYICISKSPRLIKNVSAELDIYVTQEFSAKPTDADVLYGSDHTLICQVYGVPMPQLSWFFQSTLGIDPKPIVSSGDKEILLNGSLVIKNLTMKESGSYYCVAYSPGMTKNVSAQISVVVTQKFTNVPVSQESILGSTILFDCQSEGIPPPITSWQFQSVNSNKPVLIDINERYRLLENNSLLVYDTQDADEGTFICFSVSPGLVTNVSAQLLVYSKPQLSLSTTKADVLVGQPVEVICIVNGDPAPVIQWYKLSLNSVEVPVSNKERLVFIKSKKEDIGTYICEAKNLVGVVRETFKLQVQAACSLERIESDNYLSEKYVYVENEGVSIKCKDGFKINGSSHLTCLESGSWNENMPLCEDINECEGASFSKENNSISKNPLEICDENAECLNTPGSYQCLCNEGFIMVHSNCKLVSPGSESGRGGTNRKITTTPAPQSYTWLNSLVAKYKNSIIDESSYLQALKTFVGTISKLPHHNWKVDALSRLIESLKVAVELSNEIVFNENQRDKSVNCIQIFAASVSAVLSLDFKTEWLEVNKQKNGSILLMKYMEEYIVNKVNPIKKHQLTDLLAITFENLDISIQPVTVSHQKEDFKISMLKDNVGHYVRVPSTNYPVIENSMSVAIVYKNLDKLLPNTKLENVYSPIISSQVFSLSFSHLSKAFIDPIQITFKLNKKVANEMFFCSYWDFKRPYNGGWASDSCKTSNASSRSDIICECSHLTNFAIIMPQNNAKRMVYLTFTLTAAVGIICLVLLAFLSCIAHICCLRYMQSARQTIICNINLVIIVTMIAFAGGIIISYLQLVPETLNSYFCFSLLGVIQILGVAFFGWIFAESIQLYFSTRIAIDKGSGHLVLFYFFGWGIPILLLAITGVLVYLNKFSLQSRCSLHRFSFDLVGIAVGIPSLLFILATLVMHVVISVSMHSHKELLNPYVVSHTRRALLFSKILLFVHVLLLGGVTIFLHLNSNTLYHHIFGAVALIEGIYLVIYHCFCDRRIAGFKNPKPKTNTTKDTVVTTVSGNHGNTLETLAASPSEERKSLILNTSKNLPSSESAQGLSHATRTRDSSSEQLEWDNSFADMYGIPSIGQSHEMKPLLHTQASNDVPEIIYEENLARLSHSTFDSNNHKYESFNRNANSLPRRKQRNLDVDEFSTDGSYKNKKPIQHINSRASSIVSIETHSSGVPNQVIPVYFPVAPPHYEMTMKKDERNSEMFLDSADTSCRASFVIDSDRMSNISSELTNILYELQAFNTKPNDINSLPRTRDTIDTTLSRSSTFRPESQKTKTMTLKDQNNTKQVHTDNNRIRALRARTRAEADPSDGYHGASDNYGSL